jgi:hypothetical protein
MEPQNGHGFRSIVKVLDASLIRAPQEAQDVESNEDVWKCLMPFFSGQSVVVCLLRHMQKA